MQEEAPGMVFWHANGWTIYQVLEQYMRKVQQDSGYQEIKTPQIVDFTLWKNLVMRQTMQKTCLRLILKVVTML